MGIANFTDNFYSYPTKGPSRGDTHPYWMGSWVHFSLLPANVTTSNGLTGHAGDPHLPPHQGWGFGSAYWPRSLLTHDMTSLFLARAGGGVIVELVPGQSGTIQFNSIFFIFRCMNKITIGSCPAPCLCSSLYPCSSSWDQGHYTDLGHPTPPDF